MKYTIIGAGIGGLTLALALQKHGIDYHIYERFKQIKKIGAGIWLSPNALQILDYLGVLEEVINKGNSIDRITIGKPNLEAIVDNPQTAIKKAFGYSTYAIHRADLHHILLSHINASKVDLGKEFTSYTRKDKGGIELHFSNSDSTNAEILIGADGINSMVRKQLFPNSQIRYSGQTCWRGVSKTILDQKHDNRVYELWGNQIRIGISRISPGHYYWFAVALDQPNQKDQKGQTKSKLLTMFKNFDPIVQDILSNTPEDQISRNDINNLNPLQQWHKGNICLIGDAAHATTPNMGQGGAQAIEDAYYLSQFQHINPDQFIFHKFQQFRQKKVNKIVSQSWTTGKMAHWKYAQGLRNFMLKNAPTRVIEKQMIELYSIEKIEATET